MNTTIFYFTGTGNSLWAARQVAGSLENAELVSVSDFERDRGKISSEIIGLAFPVHIWGVPDPVVRFVNQLTDLPANYFFALATNGGQVSNTLVQLEKIMKARDLRLSSGFEITLPSNYIPWGGPGSQEKQNDRFMRAREKLAAIAARVRERERIPVEKGPLWQRILFSGFYKMSYPQVSRMDRQFLADEKCTHCEICRKVCPAANITMKDGIPVWNHHCVQCFACLQWCPPEAIQYGKKTAKYERYHHPEITLRDMLKQ